MRRAITLPPRSGILFASAGLAVILVTLAVYSVWSQFESQSAATEARRATSVGEAYRDAQEKARLAELQAIDLFAGGDIAGRVEFDRTVASMIESFRIIAENGSPEDRFLVTTLLAEHLPQLAVLQRYFEAVEARRPFTEALPSPRAAREIANQLDAPGAARFDASFNKLRALEMAERRQLVGTLGAFVFALPTMCVFLVMMRRHQRREIERRVELQHLERAALTDALTGLGNNRAFQDDLQTHLDRARRHAKPLALAILDVDEFKSVNDRAGHAQGDRTLVEMARAIRALGEENRAFRIGGDEFAVVMPNIDAEEARPSLDLLRALVKTRLNGVSFSAGLATYGMGGDSPAELAESADSALYVAKRRGRDAIVLYNPDSDDSFSSVKIDAVRRILDGGGLDDMGAAFQPIWNVEHRTIIGYEALARPSAQSGLSGPQEAFDIAEQIGRTHDLDEVCRRVILARAEELPNDALLFINLSPSILEHSSFTAGGLDETVRAAGISPSQVVIEITERSSVPVGVIEREAANLRACGFKLAIDNVGTGDSGFRMMRRIEADYLKIDGSLISNALKDERGRALLFAVAQFAARTNALLIAEGIEDQQTLELMKELGKSGAGIAVHGAQGYWLGRPRMISSRPSDGNSTARPAVPAHSGSSNGGNGHDHPSITRAHPARPAGSAS